MAPGVHLVRSLVKTKFLKVAHVSAGYEYKNFKLDVDDVSGEVTFSGPVFEAGVNF